MDVWLEGKKVRVSPASALGKGGEADVFDLGDGRALKLFKPPEHPDYTGLPAEQAAARVRLDEHQRKLRAFPAGLPGRVVAPQALATDKKGQMVLGYAMRKLDAVEPLRRFGEPSFRRAGATSARVAEVLRGLHRTLDAVHASGVVVGDFNDLNVLVAGATDAYFIDADSFQFGAFLCPVFTERFLDPLRVGNSSGLVPTKPASKESDWYAFAVTVMQGLLCVGPHGGVHRPKTPGMRTTPASRVLQRVTVFHPEVQYPKPALPLSTLPDDVLHHLHRVFVEDLRGVFPLPLLEGLRFTVCGSCGVEHARGACPTCQPNATATVTPVTSARGQVTATRLFSTRGVLVHASAEDGVLRWLYHAEGAYRREDGRVVMRGPLDPSLRWELQGDTTLVGRGGEVAVLATGRAVERMGVDAPGGRPAFAANARHRYWAVGGGLWRDGAYGAERIGDVLEGQTRLFVGPRFGLGFHRAGGLRGAFVFDAGRTGLKDGLALPWPSGQLVDAECVFDGPNAWLFLTEESGGRTVHHCLVVGSDGTLRAAAVAEAGDGSWLGGGARGRCAAGDALFCATDAGLVRVELRQGRLEAVRDFPDTEPFVDSGSQLFLVKQGLAVVGRQDISALRMA
ncbi:hypothetical protein JY651_42915 [Pyxidicoccus parkwayensis]|uniref:Protein kinase domain-containing protein n=1 Tax=Pyxidicoccus parkwayensis TaxID=2813578 RepID=A0ABX7P0K2_9BACT|nr:hypothetical protein [Pyxidicoccus parkwaysis]QSQ21833.1 hypothetical protein JY651_42915 [Pyxidicoccus parkwaysis]